MAISYKPSRYHSITPYLTVRDGDQTIRFLQAAFGAETTEILRLSNGRFLHGEMKIGDSHIMIGEARGDWRPRPNQLYLYVPDTEGTYKQALEAGGKSLMEPADMFWGDRSAGIEDPDGNWWWIATHIEDVTGEELQRRAIAARG